MNDAKPPIFVHPDGSIEVSDEMATYICNTISNMVHMNHPQPTPQLISTVMAICTGYYTAYHLPDRDQLVKVQETLPSALDVGLGMGMDMNPNVPRLNS